MQYKFEDIAINSTTKKKPTEEDKDTYIGLEHLDSDCLYVTRWGADAAPTGEKLLMKKGDVLFGKRRAYQRKVGIAPFDGIFSAHGMVLRPNEEIIDKDFFPFFISSDQFMERAVRISVGGLSPTINWKDLRVQEFTLPSIEEQRILADKLWAAYRLKESYKKLLTATQEMVKSQFIEMFYGGKYTVDKLRKHIDVIRGVSYKPSDVYETHNENTSIVLRSNNIEGGQINFDDLVYVSTDRVSEFQLLSAGDIVMCGSNGSKKLVGKAAMLQSTPIARTSFGAFCLGIRCKPTLVPEYLATYFQTSLYRDKIEQLGSGSNILNIKPDHIYNLEIPIPLYDEQMAFVTIVKQTDKSEFVGCKSQFIEMFKDCNQVPLGDICNIEKGATITRNDVLPGEIPVVAGGQEPSCYHSVANRIAGAITVSASGAYAGFITFWNCPIFASDCNTIISKDDEKTDQTFIYFGLKAMQKQIYGLQKGGAQPHVYGKDLQKFMFPYPSYDKQIEFSKMAKQADKSEYYN